jgi:thioesterase domain-containing protein
MCAENYQTNLIHQVTRIDMSNFETLMPIKTKGSLPPLFCVHGEPLKMAMRIKADRPVYGLSHVYHASFQDTIADSIEELAEQYLNDVFKVWPDGPYHLLGFSAGGMVAYEMARQLIESGKKVDYLIMVEPSLGEQVVSAGAKSADLKNFVSESGLNASTIGYLASRVRKSLISRTNTLISRVKVASLLKSGKELPEDLRWLGYLRALGPAISKYEYTVAPCQAALVYRALAPDTEKLLNTFWSELLGPMTDMRYIEGVTSHNDFMLDPHLSNVGQMLDQRISETG